MKTAGSSLAQAFGDERIQRAAFTPILSQESQRHFHADARRHRANAQAFPDIGMGRKYKPKNKPET
jgi:hypothetical protein